MTADPEAPKAGCGQGAKPLESPWRTTPSATAGLLSESRSGRAIPETRVGVQRAPVTSLP